METVQVTPLTRTVASSP